MGAPTIQVSHNSVSLESRLVMPVRLNRPARLVPGPEKPGRVLLVVDVRTTRPGMRSSWPVEKAPGNGGALVCTPGPVSCRPLKPACCRFLPRKSTSMSTNQPKPLAPALAPRSGAKTSILTGLARFEAPLVETYAAAADTPMATSTAATANLSLLIVALPSFVSEDCLPRDQVSPKPPITNHLGANFAGTQVLERDIRLLPAALPADGQ